MKDAVIVSTARTPIGVAFKGSLNNIKSPTMTAHAIRHAVERAGVSGEEIDDVIIGAVLTAGTAGMNVARLSALAAGLPVTVSGQTIDRQCSSGLMAIATAAKQIIVDGMDVVVAGGQDNISAVQNQYFPWVIDAADPNRVKPRTSMRCNRRCVPPQASRRALSMTKSFRLRQPVPSRTRKAVKSVIAIRPCRRTRVIDRKPLSKALPG
jgi:acetyl-CoA acetyltransferase